MVVVMANNGYVLQSSTSTTERSVFGFPVHRPHIPSILHLCQLTSITIWHSSIFGPFADLSYIQNPPLEPSYNVIASSAWRTSKLWRKWTFIPRIPERHIYVSLRWGMPAGFTSPRLSAEIGHRLIYGKCIVRMWSHGYLPQILSGCEKRGPTLRTFNTKLRWPPNIGFGRRNWDMGNRYVRVSSRSLSNDSMLPVGALLTYLNRSKYPEAEVKGWDISLIQPKTYVPNPLIRQSKN
jgi:hypothetical protein